MCTAFICPKCATVTVETTEKLKETNKKPVCRHCYISMIQIDKPVQGSIAQKNIDLRERYCYNNQLYDEELDRQLHEETLKRAVENERNGENQATSEFDNTLFFLFFTFGSLIGGFVAFYQLTIKRGQTGLGLLLFVLILLSGQYLCKKITPNTFKETNEQIKQDRDSKNNTMCNSGLKCPVCGSHYVVKIGVLNRAASVHFLGLASSKIGKQYECKDCHHKF